MSLNQITSTELSPPVISSSIVVRSIVPEASTQNGSGLGILIEGISSKLRSMLLLAGSMIAMQPASSITLTNSIDTGRKEVGSDRVIGSEPRSTSGNIKSSS